MESVILAKAQTARSAMVSMGVDCTGVGVDPPSIQRELFSTIPDQRI